MNPFREAQQETIVEIISTRFPHLRGALHVHITDRELLYEVRRGKAGLNLEVGCSALASPARREILTRLGTAAQQVHSGLTLASRVTALDEVHV